ncbi:MAG: hypothetical protein ABI652_03300 [Acidobacteriota bacterium]
MRTLARLLTVATLVLVIGRPAIAQQPKPLPVVVVDLRAFYPKLGQDPVTAKDLSTDELEIAATDLPGRGVGGVIGVHLYPVRGKNIALGVGAEAMRTSGHAQRQDEEGLPVGPSIHQRFAGTSVALSINFGHRNGWSYVSAGIGPTSFSTYIGDTAPAKPPPTHSTINLGAGARWFNLNHLAFCFDLRFYLSRPEAITPPYPGRARQRLLIMSAGIAIK